MVELLESDPSARVMEAGCGEGSFIDAMLSAGFRNVVGFDLDAANIATCAARFPQVDLRQGDFLDTPHDDLFDAALGNPPYVQWNNIGPETRAILARPFWKPYVSGEWDLLYAFILWEVEKVRDGGEVCLIVPYNWFAATHAGSLRRYLATHGTFLSIASFGEFTPFGDAAPNTIIFHYLKGTPDATRSVRVVELTDRRADVPTLLAAWQREMAVMPTTGSYERQHGGWRAFTQAQFPADGLWYLAAPSEEAVVGDLERVCNFTLADVARVGVGVVSGCDKAFRLTDAEAAALPSAERSIVTPFVKAETCRPYRASDHALYIFPNRVSDEATLAHDFPTVYAHLTGFRADLEGRYLSASRRWFDWATPRNLNLFEGATNGIVFVPNIDRSPVGRYTYSPEQAYGSGDVLGIAPSPESGIDARFLTAWLNSPAVNAWYRIKGNRTGHRIRYTQSYVEQIPIRVPDMTNAPDRSDHARICLAVSRRVATTDPEVVAETEHEIGDCLARLCARPIISARLAA